MSRFLFLLFLVSFLFIADSAQYYLTGELQSWTSADTDFNLGSAQTYGNIFSTLLDHFGKPTYAGASIPSINSASSFYQWWNTPITKIPSLTPFSITMNDEGNGKFNFQRPSGWLPLPGVNLFSFHVRGELNCGSTSCNPSAFTVSTTDDFAMYVDGSLVCQSTGALASTNTITCTTGTLAALTGNFYTHYVDIFYARRWSGSGPSGANALSFELPGTATTCSFFSRSIYTRNIYPFGANTVQPFSNAIFYGNENSTQPMLNLVKPGDTSSFTAVYTKTPIRYQNGFSTYFKFNVTGATAEGFAFVVQDQSNQGPASGTGYGLGYSITNSLAVEFDALQSNGSLSAACEGAAPHIEIHVPASLSSTGLNTPCKPTNVGGTFTQTNNAPPNFVGGQTFEAYIEYLPGPSPSSGQGTISVWVAPLSTTLSAQGDYQSQRFTNNKFVARATVSNAALQNMFSGSTFVYPGFTAGATTLGGNVWVWDWKVNTVSIGAFNTVVAPAANGTSEVARNTQGSKSFTITLKDGCGGTVPIGTDPVTVSLMSSSPSAVGSQFVNDLTTGSYDIWWWNTLATTYNLTVNVYGQSILPGVATTVPPYLEQTPYIVTIVPDIISAPNCFFTPANIAATNFLASDVRNVTITARDQFNNTVSTPDNGFVIFFQTFPASPNIYATSQSGPNYLFQIGTHQAQDRTQIFLRYSGADIAGSPTQYLNVTAGVPPDAKQTAQTLIGKGLQGSIAGVPATIAFQVLDSWSNIHATVAPFTATALMACAPGFTDPRCNNASLVTISIAKNLAGDPSYFVITWETPVVGPCYTVNISITPAVNGSTNLPGLGTVCVLPNNVSAANSVVNAGTSYTAGSLATFTIQAKDAYNNSRTSDNSPLNPFTVSVAGVSIPCDGSSSGTQPALNNLQCQYSGAGGVYQVSFTPKTSGTQPVTVSLSGQPTVFSSNVTVLPGPGYAPNDAISGVLAQMVAGQTQTITFSSQDLYHNLRLNNSDTGSFVVSMLPIGQSSGTAIVGAVTPQGPGSYSVTLTPFLAAPHSIEVKLLGQAVSNSPINTTVVPNLTNLTISPVNGSGVFGGVAQVSTTFNLVPMDNYGNIQNKWTDTATCKVCFPDLSGTCSDPTTPCAAAESGSLFTITYTPPVYNSAQPQFVLQLSLVTNGTTAQLRNFNMFSSQSSDTQQGILKNVTTNACNTPGGALPYYVLNNSLVAGVLTQWYLYDYSDVNCSPQKNAGSNEPQFNIDFNPLAGGTKFSGTVTNDTVRTTPTQAIFDVAVVGTKVGWYKISVVANGVETTQSKSGVFAQVIPGPLDPPSCTVTPASATVVAGSPTTWTVNLKDAFQNDLVSGTGVVLTAIVRNQQGNNATVGSGLVALPVITPSGSSPVVNITFSPTTAGVGSLAIYGPSSSNPAVLQLIASKTFPITVLAGPVSQPYTCFWGPWNGTSCPDQIPTATAGQAYPVPLYARDQYNNPVNDGTVNFTLALAPQTISTVSSVFSGAAGLYTVTFQANKTVSAGALTATATVSNPLFPNVANGFANVQPADLSSLTSWVTGLGPTVIAGNLLTWVLNARDIYNNTWFNTSSSALQIGVTLSGPESATKAILATPSKGYIASSTTNPGAMYAYSYIPTTASTNALPTIDEYTVTFLYNGVELMNLSGNVPFLVFPNVPDATQTIIPPVPSLIPAGQMTNITIQLRDQYGNNIINGSLAPVEADFYNGPGTQCNGNLINQNNLVVGFSNRRGYLHLDDNQDVTDLGNGSYTLTIWTVVAGPYFAGITVNNVSTTICRQINTVFTIIPLDVDGPTSNITGQAIDNPDDVAGTSLSLYLVMRDKYQNIVNKRDQTILIGMTPSDRPNICPTNDSIPWLTDAKAPFPALPAYFTYEDNKNGSWNVNFQVYQADLYHLVVLVNTSTVQNVAIGPGCLNLTIEPWYVYTWVANPPSFVQEALTTSLRIYGKDKYGNNVTHGNHYWKLEYSRTTVDILAPYGFARDTPKFDPYQVFYNAEHFGNYTAEVTLVQDPLYADLNKYPVASFTNSTAISITPATCDRATGGAMDFRCPDPTFATLGTCITAWSTSSCPGSGTGTTPACPLSTCPGASTYCGKCPTGASQSDFPSWAGTQCPDGSYRMSSNECPDPHTCPPGWTPCADNRNCFLGDPSICPQIPTSCGAFTCPNGACVFGAYDCPTEVACSVAGSSVCPDGTCVSSPANCPSLFLCAPPNPTRCGDGSCRQSATDCPTATTCPLGYAKCETGHCVQSIVDCPIATTCNSLQVHCPDGTCRDNYALCPSSITCPSSRPVLCPDRSCVASVSLCRRTMECSNGTLPYLCPSGTCAYTMADCPTTPTCPLDTPTLCEDLTCAVTLADCNPASALSSRCPPHRPYNCPDGTCANSLETCATLGVCTPDTPVRCTTATCAVAGNACPLQSQLSCPGVLCPGGGCADALSQCPTPMTCPALYERCGDGSCRMNCTGIMRDSTTYCAFPFYECPGQEAGFSCALDPTQCPQSPTCPFDRPIRCVDRSCSVSAALCPYPPVYASGYTTCPANSFSKSIGSCSMISAGAGSSTCPWGWIKCWDETCRRIAEDCPAEPLCIIDHPNPRYVLPYLCSAGDCARNLYQCQKLDQCPPGQVRCPAYYSTGADAGIKCVNQLSECANLTQPTIALTCPLGFSQCRSGKCRTSCSSPSDEVLCPNYLPYQCGNGKCVQRPNQCQNLQNCSSTSQRCWDLTCTVGTEKCTDNPVVDAASSLNVCPLSAPYQCSSGFCALSSALCPDLPRSTACKTGSGKPFKCADGSCQMSAIQCRVIKPCFEGYTRCSNGACMVNCTFTSEKICSGSQIMCPNGLCASSLANCFNENLGCPGNMTKCDDGVCSASCGTIPSWDGCTTGSRCYDGSCSASCSAPRSCNPADPAGTPCDLPACGGTNVQCGNGVCASSFTAAGCQTAWNCPYATPFRGVDGGCYNYPSDGGSSGAANGKTKPPATGVVVCSSLRPHICKDGSCVANVTHCPAIQPCSSGVLCSDMTCASSASACAGHQCPPGSPTLCLDGSCRKFARECGVMAPPCPSPMVQCFDGFCANSSSVCVQRQYQISGKSYSPTANHGTGVCGSGEFLCWNGACLFQSTAGANPSRSASPLACPPLPACSMALPLRCWDGSCVNPNTSACASSQTCGSGTIRCEDGTCRSKGSCPQYAGCPASAPYYCAGAVVQCVVNQAACKFDSANPQVCASNCLRDGTARAQQVTVYSDFPTVVDVVIDNTLSPVTQIKFPIGALGDSTGTWTINPTTFADLQNGLTRINGLLTPRTPAQILLSPPFYLQWNGAASRAGLNLNVTVTSNIDTKLFAGATATGQIIVTNPCQIFGGWSATAIYSTKNCLYIVNVTNFTTTVYQDGSQDALCPVFGFTAQIQSVNTTTDPVQDTQQICVCSNVTQANGTQGNGTGTSYAKGDIVCALWYLQGADQTNAIFRTDKTPSCPSLTDSGPGIISFTSMTEETGKTFQCTSTAGLIDPDDICLCTFSPNAREWACTFPNYHDRILNPPWFPESGRPNYGASGLLPSSQIGFPVAFCNIPLPAPPAPVSSGESWWQKYGKIVLGVGISMFILLLILICAIARLIRYRRKYHEERAEAEELREQAQELDEKHGGLGVYDDEVEMIANPLVVEMQELQKQLEQTNAHLKTQEEMDEHQMAALDKERQRILEEIKRVKDAIAAQAKTNPTRVDEIPPSGAVAVGVGSGGTTSGGTAERQEFNQAPAARRKKQDL